MRHPSPIRRSRGLSLIECVLACLGASIMLAALAQLTPLLVQTSQSREAALLAEKSQSVAFLLGRDMDAAYPDSARVAQVGSTVFLEIAPIHALGRYRAGSPAAEGTSPCPTDDPSLIDPDHPDDDPQANDRLSIGTADTCFTTIGAFDADKVQAGDWVALPGSGPLGFYAFGAASGGAKARLSNVQMTPDGARIQIESSAFAAHSDGRRFAVVGGPRTWACDPVAGTLSAFEGYPPSAAQPTSFGVAPLASIAGIASCSAFVEGRLARFGYTLATSKASIAGGASSVMGRGSW